jgi:hypothetical protein
MDLNFRELKHELREQLIQLRKSPHSAEPTSTHTSTAQKGFEFFRCRLANRTTLLLKTVHQGSIFNFTTHSSSVCSWVIQLEKLDTLNERMAQLLGFRETLALHIAGTCDKLIDLFIRQTIVFEKVYSNMTLHIDNNEKYDPLDRQRFQGLVGHAHLNIGRFMNNATYMTERIAYGVVPSNEQKHQLQRIVWASEQSLSEVPFANKMTFESIGPDIQHKRYLLYKLAQKQGFKPYRYFLGLGHRQPPTGTGNKSLLFYMMYTWGPLCIHGVVF